MSAKHSNNKSEVLVGHYDFHESTKKELTLETVTAERPKTKLDLVCAIRDLVGITQRGVLEPYEFEQMRKPSLIALYEALKVRRVL